MKLAFTTLGCPEWDLKTVVERAKEYGFDGIDIRTIRGTNKIFELEEFGANLSDSVSIVESSGLELTCFSSSVEAFASPEEFRDFADELQSYLRLCRAFGVEQIRIFGGKIGDTPREEAVANVAENCNRYIELAGKEGVTLLFETHDSWTGSPDVKKVVESVDSEYLKVVWDVAHPFRHSGEKPEETWEMLRPWIANTHWKDSRPAEPTAEIDHDFRLCLLGEGEIPLPECAKLLGSAGYDAYYTLEWEKLWHPYIEEPEIALPHFVRYMQALEE